MLDGMTVMRGTLKLSIITNGGVMFKNGMRAVHPGEVLREDYLLPLNMSANVLAQALRVTPARINEIVL
ncbi:hypothetical protein GCM10027181_22140 [Rheinheimera gaetbuli]